MMKLVFKNFGSELGITLGTGLGPALYLKGKVEDAALRDSGFLNGIAEDYLSTKWFLNRYNELSGKSIEGVRELSAAALYDELPAQIFREFGHNLARFMIPLINYYSLEMVLSGGNISLASGAFLPKLHAVFKSDQISASVEISQLQEVAPLMGAASCLEANVRFNEV